MKEQRHRPPILAKRLLRSFLRYDLAEDVIGDLQEQFDYCLESKSPFRARINYWYQVFNYLRPFAFSKRSSSHQSNPITMYRSYVLTAIRGMVKNKMLTFINIAGLSVGLAVAITTALWIRDENSFERNFDNFEKIGMVIQHVTNNGQVETWTNTPLPLADELRKNYGTDFKHVIITSGVGDFLVVNGEKKFSMLGIFAETPFPSMFTLHMKSGSWITLQDPSAVLISESAAKSLFDNQDPMGRILVIEGITVNVGGVYEDIPEHSRFGDLKFVGSWDKLYEQSSWMKQMEDPWRPNAFETYVQLNEGANFKDASVRIKDAKLKKLNEALAKKKPALFIHPMSQWHLQSEFRNGAQTGGRLQYVKMFAIVGTFVLFMACINFMNLSTARSEKRAKEVGIRKVVGSLRAQLMGQFFVESILTTFLALIIGLLIVLFSLPSINVLVDKKLHLPWSDPLGWIVAAVFCTLVGAIAGSYPALYLSSVKAVTALKGLFRSRGVVVPRKVLVTIQFAISITLIIGTTIVYLQIRHAQNRPIGYQSSGLIAIPIASSDVHKHFDAIRNTLVRSGAAHEVSMSMATTTNTWSSSSQFDWEGKDPALSVDFNTLGSTVDYGKTIQWEIVQGRDFSRDFPGDSSAFIVNEAAANYMGFKDPIGSIVRWGGEPYTIVGVIRNMVVESPYRQARPMFYHLTPQGNYLLVKLNAGLPVHDALAKVESEVKKFSGDLPYSYRFMDEEYARKFSNEQKIASLVSVFAALAIFISCLGTFGLSSFVAEQRTKEVGVRKVLGASVYQLWKLLSKDFITLVLLSFTISVPIAYSVISAWLSGYDYRTEMPLWPFGVATIGTLFITLLTASWHTIHAAVVNPVKSLRTE